MKLSEIPKFTSVGSYQVDYEFASLIWHIDEEIKEGLVLNPDFQRGHVWTEEQQVAFIEYWLMGGDVGVLYFNAPHWPSVEKDGSYVCVDGLQRITAYQRFFNNEIKAFEHYYNEFEDRIGLKYSIRVNVNNLKTRKEVLHWYIEMNSGGTPHTKEEINRVKELLALEINKIIK